MNKDEEADADDLATEVETDRTRQKTKRDLAKFRQQERVQFFLETNSKSGNIYLTATMKCTWCAYLSQPLMGINHYNLYKSLA